MEDRKSGKIIKEARLAKGLTQKQLAERFGRSHPTISIWESGTSLPSEELARAVCQFLDVPFDEFLLPILAAERYERKIRSFDRWRETMAPEGTDLLSDLPDYSVQRLPLFDGLPTVTRDGGLQNEASKYIYVATTNGDFAQGGFAATVNRDDMCVGGIQKNDVIIVDIGVETKDRDLVVALPKDTQIIAELHIVEGGIILTGHDGQPQLYRECNIPGRIARIRKADPA